MSTTRTSITEEAYALIPGYSDAARDAAAASQWVKELAGVVPAVDAQSELADAAATGAPFPTDLPRRVREVESAVRDRIAAREMAQGFLSGARGRMASALENGADLGLAYLADELEALVADVRVADMDALTADAATIAGDPAAAAAVRAAGELVARYRELRKVQRELVGAASGSRITDRGTRLFLTTAQVADFVDAEQFWIARRRDRSVWPNDLNRHSKEQTAYRAWLIREAVPTLDALAWNDVLPKGGLVEEARALARICRGARPWVPQMDVLFQAWELGTAATEGNAMSPQQAEAGIKTVHALADVTGYASKGTPALPEGRAGGTARRLPWGHPLRGND